MEKVAVSSAWNEIAKTLENQLQKFSLKAIQKILRREFLIRIIFIFFVHITAIFIIIIRLVQLILHRDISSYF